MYSQFRRNRGEIRPIIHTHKKLEGNTLMLNDYLQAMAI